MKNIRIAGVPEHFNLAWHIGIAEEKFLEKNINLQWTDVPEGTGKLCEMLRNNQTDVAVILTEGIIKDITNGNDSKIVQIFVQTPLIWGIHVHANSKYNHLSELENTKAAISRIGSGSQLMTYVNAKNNQWDLDKIEFEIVNTIDGAIKSLENEESDYFMWEKFMTKPLVDNNIFRHLGDCPTPWPCFVIAVRNEFLIENENHIKTLLETINNITSKFKNIPNIEIILAEKFNQKVEDITLWLQKTEWTSENFSEEMLNNIQNQLLELSIINKKGNFTDIIHQ